MRHFDQGLTTLFLFSGLVGASQWFNADMTSFPHERDHSAPKQQGVQYFEAGVGASARERKRCVSVCLNRLLRRERETLRGGRGPMLAQEQDRRARAKKIVA